MNLGWTMIRIPFDAAKLWGSRGQIKIRGDINGFPFRAILFPDGTGAHFLVVNKKMQAAAHVKAGGTAQFHLELDTENRTVEMPAELEAIINQDRALKKWFGQFNHATRNWIAKWVSGVKSAEARARRADQMAERMIATMEAEHELPPALKAAFANDPIAHERWKKLSPLQRRGNLLSVFGYQDPVSRARRVRKMLDELRKQALK
jgi:uncharacterized protein YdeI (YjbR/CyaY-like superfamily)